MSLSEARKAGALGSGTGMTRRSAFRLLASTVAVGLLAAGCGNGGFRPLYGSASLGGTGAEEKLAQIEFAPVPGRVGQRIRNELIFESTGGGGETKNAVYRLEIAITESISQTLVKTDGNALSSIYNLDASFTLIRIADKKAVLTGRSFGRASFERVQSIFANVRAKEDAENRAAKTVGEELKSRLSIYLANA